MAKEIKNGVDLSLIKDKLFWNSMGSDKGIIMFKKYSPVQCITIIQYLQELNTLSQASYLPTRRLAHYLEGYYDFHILQSTGIRVMTSSGYPITIENTDRHSIRMHLSRRDGKKIKYTFRLEGSGYSGVYKSYVYRTLRYCKKFSQKDKDIIESCLNCQDLSLLTKIV